MKSNQTKTKLMLPRPLSWSSMNLLENDERRWIAKYLHGKEVNPNNSGIRFGKRFSQHLEAPDKENPDIEFEVASKGIIHYDKPEMPLSATLRVAEGEIPLIGSADTAKLDLSAFRERKTGRVPWNQAKAQAHGQMHFYAFIIFLMTKRIPDAHLDWLETEESMGMVSFTGNIQAFHVKLEPIDIIKMKRRIVKNALRIDQLVRQNIKSL